MKDYIYKTSPITCLKCIFCAAFFLTACTFLFAKEKDISFEALPKEAKNYIASHFPNAEPLKIKKEGKGKFLKYEVKLNNTVEADFNSKGEIIGLEAKIQLPNSVIPKKLLEYTEKMYPKNYITSWEINKWGQELELDDETELYFDLNGNFLRKKI